MSDPLDDYSKMIADRALRLLDEEVRLKNIYHDSISDIYRTLRKYILRWGKRIASSSTLLAYEGYKGSLDDKILDAGAAMEFYRHSILIHDDLVDRDEIRRGGKTFHKIYTTRFNEHAGESIAVFAGDLLYSLTLKTLLQSGFDRTRKEKAVEAVVTAYRDVNESQILDLIFEYKMPSIEDWERMASKRAASLFKATILVGAIMADAPRRDLELIEEAAVNIGYAFDIQDDLIDVYGSPKKYRRPLGGDILHNKKPLHMIYAFEMADKKGLKVLDEILGSSSLSEEDLSKVKDILRSCGALEKAKEYSQDRARRAKNLIGKTAMNVKAKGFFHSLIDYVYESLDWYE